MSEAFAPPERMSAEQFLLWAERQPGCYELEDGRVLAPAHERVDHVQTKGLVFAGLLRRCSGVACPASPMRMV